MCLFSGSSILEGAFALKRPDNHQLIWNLDFARWLQTQLTAARAITGRLSNHHHYGCNSLLSSVSRPWRTLTSQRSQAFTNCWLNRSQFLLEVWLSVRSLALNG